MASSAKTPPDDMHEQHERILDALEDIEDDLEALAETDTAFGERAQNALDYLEDHREGSDDE